VPPTAAAAEFCFLLLLAAVRWKHYLKRLRAPRNTQEAVSDTCTFEGYHRVVMAGLRIVDPPAPQTDAESHERLRQAVEAMREAIFNGLAWQIGALQEYPLAEVQEWGSILFAGIMRSMITMDFPRLRAALAREGNPEQVLLERLPATGYAVWHDGPRESVEKIRNRIVRVLTQDDTKDTLEDHLQRDAFDQVPGDTLSPAPDVALRLLELEDLVKAWCRQAGLTEYETDVAYYKLQDYSERAIADKLGHSEDGITQAWRSGRTKLKAIYGPEDLRRLII
jgi:hypothetical protein